MNKVVAFGSYKVVRIGGRIKASAVGLDILYPEEYNPYLENPNEETVQRLYNKLRSLREQPPDNLLRSFFPVQEKIKQMVRGIGFYRPILKTDQGPAGCFLGFEISEKGTGHKHRIAAREGLAVPELFCKEALGNNGAEAYFTRIIELYRNNQSAECYKALAELEAGNESLHRTALVGRNAFFFCNPSSSDKPIVIGEEIVQKIEVMANELLNRFEAKADAARDKIRKGYSLEQALAESSGCEERPLRPLAHYLQVDAFIDEHGDIAIEKINLPDVVLFLTEIDPGNNATFQRVQALVRELKKEIIQTIDDHIPRQVYLLTRDEVLINKEDTLELLEIQSLKYALEQLGHDVQIIGKDGLKQLKQGSHVLLMNIDIGDPGYEELLVRSANKDIYCSPDPLLRVFEKEMTTLRTYSINGKQLAYFMAGINPGKQISASSLLARNKDIENIYRRGNFLSDILYIDVSGERAIVPVIRHSLHSFFSLYNLCKKHDFPPLRVKEVPINRYNAGLLSEDGPRIAAYRFLMVRA